MELLLDSGVETDHQAANSASSGLKQETLQFCSFVNLPLLTMGIYSTAAYKVMSCRVGLYRSFGLLVAFDERT